MLGQQQTVLMQPVQTSGIDELLALQIQPSELCLRNAGVTLKDQAMAQNLIYFVEREHTGKEQTGSDAVTVLASARGGSASPPAVQPRPPTAPQLMGGSVMEVGD